MLSLGNGFVQSCAPTDLLASYKPVFAFPSRELLEKIGSAIFGAVINKYDLKVGISLKLSAFDVFLDHTCSVPSGFYYVDPGFSMFKVPAGCNQG